MSLQSLNCLRMEQLLLERAKQEERIAESIRTLTPKSTIEDLLALKELSAERQKTLNNIEETDKRLEPIRSLQDYRSRTIRPDTTAIELKTSSSSCAIPTNTYRNNSERDTVPSTGADYRIPKRFEQPSKSYPAVMWFKGAYRAFCCFVCGANVNAKGEWWDGAKGLQTHTLRCMLIHKKSVKDFRMDDNDEKLGYREMAEICVDRDAACELAPADVVLIKKGLKPNVSTEKKLSFTHIFNEIKQEKAGTKRKRTDRESATRKWRRISQANQAKVGNSLAPCKSEETSPPHDVMPHKRLAGDSLSSTTGKFACYLALEDDEAEDDASAPLKRHRNAGQSFSSEENS